MPFHYGLGRSGVELWILSVGCYKLLRLELKIEFRVLGHGAYGFGV